MTNIGDVNFDIQIGVGVIGKAATAVLGILGSILIARIVGPSGYGVFYISMSIVQFLENPITGWTTACKKRMTEEGFNESEAFGSVILVILGIIFIFGPASFLVLNVVTSNPVIPVAVPSLLITISSYWALNIFLSGRGNFSLYVWSGTINTLVQITGKIILVISGFGVWGMVGGTIIGPFVIIPLIYRWISIRPSIPSLESLKSISEYARWSIPDGFLGTALSRMDIVLLGWLATAGMAGRYQVGLKITMPAVFISSVIRTGLMGRVSNLDSRGEDWKTDLRRSLSYASLLSVPIFFGSLVIGETLVVAVFGNEYQGAGVFVVGLALHRLIKSQTSPFHSIITGMNKPDIKFRISFISFASNAILGILLWLFIGPVGIIIATILTSGVRYLLSIEYVRHITDVEIFITAPFLKQLLSSIVMAIVLYGLKNIYGISNSVDVIGYVVVGGGLYCGLEFLLCPNFRDIIFRIRRYIKQY